MDKIKNKLLYQIIKCRKRKNNISYFDNERIFGYDFLTYSASFNDVITSISTNTSESRLSEYLDKCLQKEEFNIQAPLTKFDRPTIRYISDRFNEIDDYLIEQEHKILTDLKGMSIDEFNCLPISKLGFNNYINNILNELGIYTIQDLTNSENTIELDSNMAKIIYSKLNTIKFKLFNINYNNPKHSPITTVIDTDYKSYNRLRLEEIYTLEDLSVLPLERIQEITKLKPLSMYKLITKLKFNNIHLSEESVAQVDIGTLRTISISSIIFPDNLWIRERFSQIGAKKLGDLELMNMLDLTKLDKLMLSYFPRIYLNDILFRVVRGLYEEEKNTCENGKNRVKKPHKI